MTTLALQQKSALPAYAILPPSLRAAAIDALYVHVPFCTTKCHYCDFYSLADHLGQADIYLDALAAEIRLHLQFFPKPRPRTIFIGGGTPTLLPQKALERLFTLLQENFDFSDLVEFTVEANPNTFDAQKARILAAHRVNRISFGAQSFNPGELATLQRDHDPASVPAAFHIARHAGIHNLNLDLIFGIPGQTLASWEYSLAQALDLHPDHISCYSLTYEANTPMTARMHRGDFQKIDESLELDMFQHVFSRLRNAGFQRYEISNFARLDSAGKNPRACQHNILYWKAGNWLGLGPSAGSHVASSAGLTDRSASQWKNAGSLTHYLEALRNDGVLPVTQFETLPPNKWIAACAVFWLRLAEGLNFAEFTARLGFDPSAILRNVLRPFCETGFAEISATAAKITEAGVPVSNHILTRVLAAIEEGFPA